jgi:hypothetical protein
MLKFLHFNVRYSLFDVHYSSIFFLFLRRGVISNLSAQNFNHGGTKGTKGHGVPSVYLCDLRVSVVNFFQPADTVIPSGCCRMTFHDKP